MRLDRLFMPGRISLQGGRSVHIERARLRMVLMSGLFACAYLLLAVRAFDLSVFQAVQERAELSEAPTEQASDVQAMAPRGRILDRNGLVLASSLPMAALSANPSLILEPQKVAAGLAKIFPDLDRRALSEKLSSKNKRLSARGAGWAFGGLYRSGWCRAGRG